MTRDTANDVVPYTPTTIFSQVLNPDKVPWPIGALVLMYQILDFPGWYWGEPVIQYGDTDTVSLSLDTSTDTVYAHVRAQLSIDASHGAVKLVNDSIPTRNQYYGTPASATTLGYWSVPQAVAGAVSDPAVLDALILNLFGVLPQNGLTLIAGGGGLVVVGLDQVDASATIEDSTSNWDVGVSDDDQLVFTWTEVNYRNTFNAANFILTRTILGSNAKEAVITFEGGDSMSVLSDAETATFTFVVLHQMSIASDLSGLKLVNDQGAPGAAHVYSTNEVGAKGWHGTDGFWLNMVSGVLSHVGPQTSGGSTITWPSSLSWDARGHVYAAVGGVAPVTSIITVNDAGGPLHGDVTFQGGTGIELVVTGNTIVINGMGGPFGPAPSGAPTLTATPGNAQVSLSWTTVTGATSYALYRGGSLIDSTSGTTFVDTGLTNGVTYNYTVNGVNNHLQGPAGSASATPMAPAVSGTASGTGTSVTLPANTSGTGILVLIIYYNAASGTTPTPSGWTLALSWNDADIDGNAYCFYRTANGATTLTIPHTANWQSYYISGKTALDVDNSNTGSLGGPIVAASVTTTAAADVDIVAYVVSGTCTISNPTGFTQVASTSTGGFSLATSYRTAGAAGATGTATATLSPSSSQFNAVGRFCWK
jgi:hypothetical protein